jgi:hypothetical protein
MGDFHTNRASPFVTPFFGLSKFVSLRNSLVRFGHDFVKSRRQSFHTSKVIFFEAQFVFVVQM